MLFSFGKKAANQCAQLHATAVVKHYGFQRQSVFSTEGSFGNQCDFNSAPPKYFLRFSGFFLYDFCGKTCAILRFAI